MIVIKRDTHIGIVSKLTRKMHGVEVCVCVCILSSPADIFVCARL